MIALFLEETKYLPDPADNVVIPVTDRETRRSVPGQGGIAAAPPHAKGNSEKNTGGKSPPEEMHHTSMVAYNAGQDTEQKRLVEIESSIPIRPRFRRYALVATNGSSQPV